MDIREKIHSMEAEGASEITELDLRFFIGLLLGIYGLILAIYGILAPGESSLADFGGFDLNLWWGLVMLIIGLAFFIPSHKPKLWRK